MCAPTADKDRRGAVAMTRPASALLTVPLGMGAVDLATTFRFVGAQARIGLLHDHVLVHQANVDLGLKNLGWQVNRPNFFANHIPYRDFHCLTLSG
jgi:hypothetical protein